MPFLTAFNFLSATAPQLIGLATQNGESSSNGQALVILWLAPVLAVVAVLIAALQFRSATQASLGRTAGGWLIALGIVGIALYLGMLVYINSLFYTNSSSFSGYNGPSVFSFLGAGFWVFVISMVVVIVGGAMGLSAGNSAPVMAAPPQPFMPYQQQPPTQYPPYQQQQPPTQYPPAQQPWSPPPEFPPSPNPPGSPKWPPSQPS